MPRPEHYDRARGNLERPSRAAARCDPPRRPAGRITVGVVLMLLAIVLFAGGIETVIEPSAVVAGSSNRSRSPDTDREAVLGGFLLCLFGITVLCCGIGIVTKKPSARTQSSNKTR